MQESDNPYVTNLLYVLNRFGTELVQVYEFTYPNELTKHYIVRSTDKRPILFDANIQTDFVRLLEYLAKLIVNALNSLENNKEN